MAWRSRRTALFHGDNVVPVRTRPRMAHAAGEGMPHGIIERGFHLRSHRRQRHNRFYDRVLGTTLHCRERKQDGLLEARTE
jgi:hypothetical protein